MEPVLLGVALLLGVKHAFDADHLVAIGGILSRSSSRLQAVRLSLGWSAGHMLTAGLITALLFWGRWAFLERWLARMELLVPALLIAVGVLGLLWAAHRLHAHRHAHGTRAHAHLHVHLNERHEAAKLGAIGLVHGLASNDELLVVILGTLAAGTLGEALLMIVLFSLGVVAGMVGYAATIQAVASPQRRPWVGWWTNVTMSLVSIGYATWMLA